MFEGIYRRLACSSDRPRILCGDFNTPQKEMADGEVVTWGQDTEEISECRVQFGSNAYRIFCFFLGNSVVVLTHGYVKKSQRTSKQEIERAEAYRRDFLKRRQKDE